MIKIYKNQEKKRILLFLLIRIFIVILIFLELQSERGFFLYLYLLVFLFTFIPSAIQRIFTISFPFEFEFIYLISLLGALSFEQFFRGSFVQIALGIFFGIVGFLIMYILYHNSRMKSRGIDNP